ncbi:MAG: hypothetical protein HY203_06055 [Nitrospirae bacterium]|nr:hypothetical protein [Nitrospirota bacterium]
MQRHAKYLTCILTAGIWLTVSGIGWAQDVVAVSGSALGPYREAFDGFQEAFGLTVPSYSLSEDNVKLPPETRIVVAFGGKAALFPYPENVTLIYCMAPGIKLTPGDRHGYSVEIEMLPPASLILPKLKEIQPSLKRLAVLWTSESMKRHVEELRQASAQVGIEIVSQQLKSPDELPERLRSLYGKIDAVWLMPDPLLINSQSFTVLKGFSWSNRVPFYVPTAGLVEQGATASISTSFREIGRAAALAARQTLSGKSVEAMVYPEKMMIVLSLKAAGNAGLVISPELLKNLDRVVP